MSKHPGRVAMGGSHEEELPFVVNFTYHATVSVTDGSYEVGFRVVRVRSALMRLLNTNQPEEKR